MENLYVHSFETCFGIVHTAATEKGLAIVSLPGKSRQAFEIRINKLFPRYQILTGGSINKEAEKQITSYLAGRLTGFGIRLDIHGTPFQKKILREVIKIPYGKTATYGEIARKTGNPKASRAVGNVNAQNCLPLVIPCHRVVAADNLGGYGGGLNMKIKLLKLEGVL